MRISLTSRGDFPTFLKQSNSLLKDEKRWLFAGFPPGWIALKFPGIPSE